MTSLSSTFFKDQFVEIEYTNYRGERGRRTIRPVAISFDLTPWHPEPHWILYAFDTSSGAMRGFAMKDIHDWAPKEENA